MHSDHCKPPRIKQLPGTDLLEYLCAENEKDRVHMVGTKSDDTKNAVQLAPEVLSKYVGTYERSISQGKIIQSIIIALEDGGLTLSGFGLVNRPMTALSETTFTTGAYHFEFGKNDKGEVIHLLIIGPEGNRRMDRKK